MFNFDITTVSATIEVYPTGKYPIIVLSDPKPYKQEGTAKKDNPEEKWPDKMGLRYTLRIADGEFKGKALMYGPDVNYDNGTGLKQFMMAAMGYKVDRASEDKFNEDMKAKYGDDIIAASSFDADTNTVGDLWKQAKNNTLFVNLDVNAVGDKVYQKIGKFEPVE